ncbi:E3 SUMO-protein ligase ZBED1-like [Haliotis rufescens]|uniref:E3 SUMO-protein ligase ZBED1-like n=1 Tax=Haliotis rufescens TaxID=6454 RepID=UPI001EAFBE6C|nr:E3 SUMO-protein ligase ZBED1-like [Haliotis rufescens]
MAALCEASDVSEFIKPLASFKSAVWKHFLLSRDKTKAAHLKRRHASEDVQIHKRAKLDPQTSKSSLKNSAGENIMNMFRRKEKLPPNSERSKAITKALAQFIVKDLQPFSIVESEGFVNLVKTLEPRYKLPNRKTLSKKIIPEMYEETKQEVIDKLSQAEAVSLTTDGWTRIIEESHTGVNIGKVLKDALEEWGLQHKQTDLVTDNAANTGIAAEVADMKHISCFAHTLNLATQKGLKLPRPAIYATLIATKEIKRKETDINTLSETDIQNLEGATEVLCEEKFPTLSIVAPMLHLIKTQMFIKDEDPPFVKEVKTALFADLNKRYTKPEVLQILHTASAVDPRFKSLPFLKDDEKASVLTDLSTSVAEYWDSNCPLTKVKQEPEPTQHQWTHPCPI